MSDGKAIGPIELPLEDYPGLNPLALDFVRGEPRASSFFGPPGQSIRTPSSELTDALAKSNARWGNDVEDLIARWKQGARTIVAGQQAGFAGGPLYTLTKIASLLDLQSSLAERDIDAVPVFWIASEDHDFDEVARATLRVGRDLVTVRSLRGPGDRSCVGPQKIPEDLVEAFLGAMNCERPDWLEERINFTDSFARLVSATAGGRLILVDALLPELRREGASLLESIRERTDEILERIEGNSRDLRDAGYQPQVEPKEEGESIHLLYELDEKLRRVPIDSDREIAPERLSTAALARPLLQDAVFTPLAFVGGPAEVAYYAQLRGIHEMLEVHRPEVMLRAHALVAPAKELRAAFRHGLQPDEIFFDPATTIIEREDSLQGALEEEVRSMKSELDERLGRLHERITDLDPTLDRPFERSRRSIGYHLDRARKRGIRAIVRRDRERFAAFERLHETLLPGGVPQDRLVSWLSVQMYGKTDLLMMLKDHCMPQNDIISILPIGGGS